jgi:hypothetical protein
MACKRVRGAADGSPYVNFISGNTQQPVSYNIDKEKYIIVNMSPHIIVRYRVHISKLLHNFFIHA